MAACAVSISPWEVVHRTADLVGALLAEYAEDFVVGLAAVEDDGQAELSRQPDLLAEGLVLRCAVGHVVEEVEADLAYYDDLVGGGGALSELSVDALVDGASQVHGVDSDARVEFRERLC